jgi:hypothetical protein
MAAPTHEHGDSENSGDYYAGQEAALRIGFVRWNALECARVRHKLGTKSDREKFSGGQLSEMNGGLGRD